MRGRPRPVPLNIPAGAKPATFKLSDSGVFEEGGLVLSKAGCVIPARDAPGAGGPEAQAAQLLLQQQPQLIAAVGGRPASPYGGGDLFAPSDTGALQASPTPGTRWRSPALHKEPRQLWSDQRWPDGDEDQGAASQQQGRGGAGARERRPGHGPPPAAAASPPPGAQAHGGAQQEAAQQLPGQERAQQEQGQRGRIALEDLEELGIVGSGSSGVVKKVRHRPTGEVLVLKVIQFDVNNEQLRKQVTTELRSLAGSRHPHVVAYRQSYLANGAVTILMEHMDAGSLADLLARVPRLPERLLVEVTRQVVSGLAYLHAQLRIVHRDIKPSNLLLTTGRAARGAAGGASSGGGGGGGSNSSSISSTSSASGGGGGAALKISDFGVSGQLSSSVSKCASWVGTVTYMSPERIRGDAYSFNTDVWSVGMVLVEAATGRFPYPPPGEGGAAPGGLGFWELLEYIVVEPAPRLPADSFSPECRDFVHACLRKDPSERPSASDLLNHPWLRRHAPADIGPLLARCARASAAGASTLGGGGGNGAAGGRVAAAAARASREGLVRSSGGARAAAAFGGGGGGAAARAAASGAGPIQAAGAAAAQRQARPQPQPAPSQQHPHQQKPPHAQPQQGAAERGVRGGSELGGGGGGGGGSSWAAPGRSLGAQQHPAVDAGAPLSSYGACAPSGRPRGDAAAGAPAAPAPLSPGGGGGGGGLPARMLARAPVACAAPGRGVSGGAGGGAPVTANLRYSGLRGVAGGSLARRTSSSSSSGSIAGACAPVAAAGGGGGGGGGKGLASYLSPAPGARVPAAASAAAAAPAAPAAVSGLAAAGVAAAGGTPRARGLGQAGRGDVYR